MRAQHVRAAGENFEQFIRLRRKGRSGIVERGDQRVDQRQMRAGVFVQFRAGYLFQFRNQRLHAQRRLHDRVAVHQRVDRGIAFDGRGERFEWRLARNPMHAGQSGEPAPGGRVGMMGIVGRQALQHGQRAQFVVARNRGGGGDERGAIRGRLRKRALDQPLEAPAFNQRARSRTQ